MPWVRACEGGTTSPLTITGWLLLTGSLFVAGFLLPLHQLPVGSTPPTIVGHEIWERLVVYTCLATVAALRLIYLFWRRETGGEIDPPPPPSEPALTRPLLILDR